MSAPLPRVEPAASWRVAVTRDEEPDGPLSQALCRHGFTAVACPVVEERPGREPALLVAAVETLQEFDWVIVSSARAVRVMAGIRPAPWPRGIRTAAVGAKTAARLLELGVDPPPVFASHGGADELWENLVSLDRWFGRRVLLPTVPGGRRTLIEALQRAGAAVSEVETYRMEPVSPDRIRAAWKVGCPQAAVVASPSAGRTLVAALGLEVLANLAAVVAIGPSTAAALRDAGLQPTIAPGTTFEDVARHLARLRASVPADVRARRSDG